VDRSRKLAALERSHVEHLQFDARKRVAALSEAERGLLRSLLAGHSSKEQAFAPGVDVAEIGRSIGVVLEKLGAATKADAVRIGIYAGMDEMN